MQSFARTKVKNHFLSYESLQRPDTYRRLVNKEHLLHRFKVSTNRVMQLKKSSFWNLKPYQFAIPLLDAGNIYVGTDAGVFYAIDSKREKKLWMVNTLGPIHSKAAIADNQIYFGDSEATVYALNAETGAELWRAKVDAEVLSTPLVLGQRVYVADLSGRLYAFDRATGMQVWHTETNERSIGFSVRRASSPVAVNGLIVFGTSSGGLLAYRESDGSLVYARQLGNKRSQVYDVDSTPLVFGGYIFASSADGNLFKLNAGTGEVLWSVEAGGADDLQLRDNRIYASGMGVLTALDPETGNIFWQQDLETPEISSPAGEEHYVAVVTTMDKFYLIDSVSGDVAYERFIKKGSFSDPVLHDGKIYLLGNTGKLYAFKVRELPPKKQRKK